MEGKNLIDATFKSATPAGAAGFVRSGAAQLLCLFVQLHVRHQDVLLRLLREVGVGAAVAGTFIGSPGPNGSPTV